MANLRFISRAVARSAPTGNVLTKLPVGYRMKPAVLCTYYLYCSAAGPGPTSSSLAHASAASYIHPPITLGTERERERERWVVARSVDQPTHWM